MTGEGAGRVWAVSDTQDLRPYAITGGRTRPDHLMRLDTVLTATGSARTEDLPPEAAHAVELCRTHHRAVAEIAATIDQPVHTTKIILSDLVNSGALTVPGPRVPSDVAALPQLLDALHAGLRLHFAEAG